ncbi:ly6/PLAUR domain-containing protein 2 [Rhinichthys klamathensis goyatoka]|uniref:ly6/PLAUR domain-containing protein 2 n=1 Tax=Rhinichthys klamathensis goyatoka TaxID=3034132 RepID=UPI0024B62A13|nr:ly6/PLAUR domain-containing protein 2 [Rhinichthys klamathensis goyatoka]
MNQQVSVVLFFISLTGGYSLKCYSCTSLSGSCEVKEQTCPGGVSQCSSTTGEQSIGSSKVSVIIKGCSSECVPGTLTLPAGGTGTMSCCNTDLCNAADGVYKGSFLLLVSPLLFYFLFQ